MRRALAGAALVAGLFGAAAPALAQVPAPRARLLVIGLPEAEARAFAERRAAALGLGVYPDSRAAADFLRQIGFGAPPSSGPAVRSGRPGVLREALDRAGLSVGIAVAGRASGEPIAALADAFSIGAPALASIDEAIRRDVAVLVLDRAEDAVALRLLTGARAVVIGAGERTPALVAVPSRDGMLSGGIARRRGIVTPYDVAATVLEAAGVPSGDEIIGSALRIDERRSPLAEADALAARMERDAGTGFGITFAAAAFVVAAILAAIASRPLAPDASARLLQAAAWAPIGYTGALFVPHEDPVVRSAAVAAAFLVGLALPPRRMRAVVALGGLGLATAICVLTLVAAARPNGEPALSLWGDPLESWRFFGLRNHMIAFLLNGLVSASALVAVPGPALATIGLAFLLVAGAPILGANFVGVLVLGLAVAVGLLARPQGRVRIRHLAIAAVAGAALFAAALAADAARDATHGGRAVTAISSGGADAAWNIVRHRIELNAAQIRDFYPPGGYALAGAEALVMLAALAWAMRPARERVDVIHWEEVDDGEFDVEIGTQDVDPSERYRSFRAGLAAAAAGGLVMLALEDSGVLAAATVGFAVVILALVPWVERAQQRQELARALIEGDLSWRSDEPTPGGA